jgi:tRNA-Thr(GGU) m(6)t(6)A37 methyltransferase TsaA
MNENFSVSPIGYVKRENKIQIHLNDRYKAGLLEVNNFSHLLVVWWGHKYESYREQIDMQMKPPYAPDVLTGLFATRSPVRPNPINISVCQIREVNQQKGIVTINEIDAFDDTPVLDLKVYFPTCDRVKTPVVPARFTEWGEWIPDTGIPPEHYDE